MSPRPIPGTTAALLALCLAGCASEGESAKVVVGLTTDLAVGFDLYRIEVTTKIDGVAGETERFSYQDGDLALPAELAVEAQDGALVELTIEAFRPKEPQPFLVRTAATRAALGRELFLPASLDEACSGVVCAVGSTCAEGACVDPFVPPSALDEHDPAWITSAPDACKSPSSGDPVIAIGEGQSAFAPLADGDVVPIEAGAQGGHHVWLALHVSGLRQMGSRLTMEGNFPDIDHKLYPVISMVTLRRADEGELCELRGLRFQVDHSVAVEAVKGQTLDIDVKLEDPDGDVAAATKRVVIAP